MGRPRNDPGLTGPWNGIALYLARSDAGMTQAELCARLGRAGVHATPSTIRRWENQDNAPPREAVRALVSILRRRLRTFTEPRERLIRR